MPETLDVLLVLWLAAAAAYQIFSLSALDRLLRRRDETTTQVLPTCTILRPLRGAGGAVEANLESLLATGAPIVLGVESGNDEAAVIARRVASRHPGAPLTLHIGPAREGSNRKVANLLRMVPDARGEILVITDGDIGVPSGYLPSVLAPFSDPAVGLVTCPYRSVGGSSVSERVDVLLTNTGFLPSIAAAERIEGVKFALGATLAIRKSLLEEIGGLEPLRDLLADDHALAARVLAAGRRVILAPVLLDHHIGSRGIAAVWRRQLRWARTTRSVRPGGYAGTIVTHGVAPAAALGFLAPFPLSLIAPLVWLGARLTSVGRVMGRLALTPRDLLLLPLADLFAFGLYLAGLRGNVIDWGGRRMVVARGGRLIDSEGSRASVRRQGKASHGRSGPARPSIAGAGTEEK